MRLSRVLGLVMLIAAAIISPRLAHAQAAPGQVTGSCGTSSQTAGNPSYLFVTPTGYLCVSATFSGTLSSTITGPLGTQSIANSVAVTDPSLQAGGYAAGLLSAGVGTFGASGFPSQGIGICLSDSSTATTCDKGIAHAGDGGMEVWNTGGTVQPIGASTGGLSTFSKQVANNTTSVAVDASPGTAYSVRLWNISATAAWLKLYNAAQGSTTCGSGTPVMRELIPGNANGAGAVIQISLGVAFSTAITACVTTGFADSDTTAPAASTYVYEIDYK